MRLLEPRHPSRPDAVHSRIVEDLLELAHAGQHDALDAIIAMLEDLCVHALNSRYALTLKGIPIWELKTRARGGPKGGARVYFFPLEVVQDAADGSEHRETFAVVVNAEVKRGDTPSPTKLAEALELYLAFRHDPVTLIRRSS